MRSAGADLWGMHTPRSLSQKRSLGRGSDSQTAALICLQRPEMHRAGREVGEGVSSVKMLMNFSRYV